MTPPMTRANAATLTLATRIAAAACAVGAVALAVAGLPERQPPQPVTPVANTPQTGVITPTGQPGPGTAPLDAAGLAARLSLFDNAPQIAKAPVFDPGRVTIEPDPAENDYITSIKSFAGRVRYLGMVQAGEHRSAFVKIDGVQRIVRQGATVNPPADNPELSPLTIERINGRAIVVTNGEARANIDLESRTGPSITMVGGGDVAQVAAEEEQEASVLSVRMDGHEVRASEVARRQRNMERQNAGIRNTNPEAQLRPPEVIRAGGLSNRSRPGTVRRDTVTPQRPEQDQPQEQPEEPQRSDD